MADNNWNRNIGMSRAKQREYKKLTGKYPEQAAEALVLESDTYKKWLPQDQKWLLLDRLRFQYRWLALSDKGALNGF